MSGGQIESLVYLSILGVALVFMAVVRTRQSLGTTMRHLATWALIFLGAIAAAGLWDDIRRNTMGFEDAMITQTGAIALPRAADGHYYAAVSVNDVPVRFVVDTGATSIVLSPRDAARVGLETDTLVYLGQAQTANGIVRTAPVTLDSLSLGPVTARRVPAVVNEAEMTESLLGMAYLDRFSRIEIAGGQMVLHP